MSDVRENPTLRAPTLDDVDALHALVNLINVHAGREELMSLQEVAEMWDDPDDDPADDLRVVDDPAGEGLTAWGRVSHSPAGERMERAFLDGGVHPDHRGRGLGRTMMAWLDQRAEERLSATPSHLEAVVFADRLEGESDRAHLHHRFGYVDSRYFDELQRPLDDLPAIPTLDGIEILPWSERFDEPSCHVYNAAFADHWGSAPRSVDSWCNGLLKESSYRLDLSFVAVDPTVSEHDGLVAYSLNAHYAEDVLVTGRLDGWVASLGTLRTHRRRGLAGALITHSLHAFAAAGFDSSMLGVDTENPSGAYRLYETLGYRPLRRGINAMRVIRTPQPAPS